MAVGMIFAALSMLWSSKIGKVRQRERLLDNISWSGDERVLDVGCGRGLLLIGAANRLTTGHATGIDIWQTEDLSGNSLEATLENARREGVTERIDVQTANMRKMPFTDGSFDVIVSRAAIHNLYSPEERAAAIREIARVLKPGGRALIDDIRHQRQYSTVFAENGCRDIRRLDSTAMSAFWTLLTFGSLQPVTLLVRKTG
jgi:ubiquinone/menaquinone biosynthesis C-methylase UbiE